MAILLGIDAGTTSISAALYDTDTHSVVETISNPHHAYIGGLLSGRREQDPEKILNCVYGTIDQLCSSVEGIGGVDSIGVTGQMHGYTLIGDAGEPVSNTVTWEDSRALETGDSGGTILAEFEEIFRGCVEPEEAVSVGHGYAAVNMFHLLRHGAPGSGYTICSVQDWLLFELSGRAPEKHVTDPSFAHSTGFYLPRRGRWNESLIEELELSLDNFPTIEPTGRRVGVTAGVASLTDGIPLCAGLGDNQASFLGSVARVADSVLVNIGTGSQISIWSQTHRIVDGLDTRPFPGDGFLLVGAPLCGGRALSIVYDLVSEIADTFFGQKTKPEDVYPRLLSGVKYDTDLVCSTLFSGSRIDPGARGSFTNMSLENFTLGDVTGAVIRGISDELADLYDRSGVVAASLIGSGNGIRRNPVMAKSLSDRFGLPLIMAPFEEGAAIGAAFAAGIGIGVFRDIDDVHLEVELAS